MCLLPLIHSRVDDQGRYIFRMGKLAGMKCIVANICMSLPPFSLDSLSCSAQFVAPYSDIPIWVLGDFNVIDTSIDMFSPHSRCPGGPSGSTSFARLISEIWF